MSLQVWLPLNGSIVQQGLSEIVMNCSSPSWDNVGKIGKCANFTGDVTNTIYNNTTDFNYIDNFSWAIWINTNFTSGTAQYAFTNGRADMGGYGYGLQCTSTTNCSCRFGNFSQSIEVIGGQWTHIAFTKKDTTICIYKNGSLLNTYTFNGTLPTYSDGNGLGLGCFHYSSNIYPFYGKLNDFRIYDHALSAKEVEEIAKGLVLHYKLDGNGKGNDNILINTHFDNRYTQSSGWDTSKNGTLLANSWGGYNSGVNNSATVYHAHLKEFNGEYVYEYIKTANESWLGIAQGGLQTKIVAGQTYTFSWEEYHIDGVNRVGTGLYYYKTGATSANFHLGVQSDANITRVLGQWQKYSYTFTAPSDADYSKNMSWYIYGHYNGNGTFYMRRPKLELGSSATLWTPNSNDGIYNLYNTSIVYDSSGYNNNGTITGTISLDTNTPRYSASTYFNGSSDIRSEKSSFGWFDFKEGTVASWYNPANTSQPWASVGVQNDSGTGSRSFNVCNYSGKAATVVGYDSSWGNVSSDFSMAANTWYHLCATITNGDTVKLYVNGNLVQTRTVINSTGVIASTTQFAVGVDLPGSDEHFTGLLSDVRFYVTALTEAQIKELYNTSVTIDKNGNVYAREVIE